MPGGLTLGVVSIEDKTMKKHIILALSLFVVSCSSPQKEEAASKTGERETFVQAQKKARAKDASAMKKGPFLEYIYEIQPDHKGEGYSISSAQLSDGYAYGSGPYDGWFVEFYLFRGEDRDIVFRTQRGFEVKMDQMKYGSLIEPFIFTQELMRKAPLSEVWPVKKMDALFEQQKKKMLELPQFAGVGEDKWNFHQLVRPPVKGTTVEMKLCQKLPEPPFAVFTPCALVGKLEWNNKTFELKPADEFVLSEENIN